jgi:hypothetical protein
MLYYTLPDLPADLINTFLRQSYKNCNLYTASSLPALAKISHLAANPKAYRSIADALVNSKGIMASLKADAFQEEDYELAKGYVYSKMNTDPAPNSPQFTEEFINLFGKVALKFKDWDCIFTLYERTQAATGKHNSPVIYAALMQYIHEHDIEGSKKEAMDSNLHSEIIQKFKHDYADNYKLLFKHPAASESYANALYAAGEYHASALVSTR